MSAALKQAIQDVVDTLTSPLTTVEGKLVAEYSATSLGWPQNVEGDLISLYNIPDFALPPPRGKNEHIYHGLSCISQRRQRRRIYQC